MIKKIDLTHLDDCETYFLATGKVEVDGLDLTVQGQGSIYQQAMMVASIITYAEKLGFLELVYEYRNRAQGIKLTDRTVIPQADGQVH